MKYAKIQQVESIERIEMSKETERFSARLHEALDDYGFIKGPGRQSALGRMFGVNPRSARMWLESEGFPKTERCIEIAKKLGVNLEWLLTGRGHKNNYEKSTPEDQIFITIYENLPTEAKKEIMGYAAFVLDRIEEKESRQPKPTSKDIKNLIK